MSKRNVVFTLLLGGLAFVAGAAAPPPSAAGELKVIDGFLARQMDVFKRTGPRILQSYAADPKLKYRGDVYDTSLGAIYFVVRGKLKRARPLVDALIFLQKRDPVGDGRTHAAYWANNLLDPKRKHTSIMDPNVGVGNMCWQGIALARFYQATKEKKYLDAAEATAEWILRHCKKVDGPGGFSGGLVGWEYRPVKWRSTEHNAAVFALSRQLHNLTGKRKWKDMAEHARNFLRGMFDAKGGYYLTGTKGKDGTLPNRHPVPADAQTLLMLSGADKEENARRALKWLTRKLLVTDKVKGKAYKGVKFSSGGDHIHCEQTAIAAMALSLAGQRAESEQLLQTLGKVGRMKAAQGLVATPWADGAKTGYGSRYVSAPHVASTAWWGLALLVAEGKTEANPLRPIKRTAATAR